MSYFNFNNNVSKELFDLIEEKSEKEIIEENRKKIYPKDLVLAMLKNKNKNIEWMLELFKTEKNNICEDLVAIKIEDGRSDNRRGIDRSLAYLLQSADKISHKYKSSEVDIEHVIYAILTYTGTNKNIISVKDTLCKYGIISEEYKKNIIIDNRENTRNLKEIIKSEISKINEEAILKRKINYDKAKISLIKNGYIDDLNEISQKENVIMIGRDKEINRCIQILCKKRHKNIIIIGDTGIGKTGLVYYLAKKISENEIPDKLKESTIYGLNISNIIAGSQYRGQYEGRLKEAIGFFTLSAESEIKNIMFIDDIQSVINTGSSSDGSINGSSIIRPFLSNGKFSCIGTITQENYRKYLLNDNQLNRLFTKVFVSEPTLEHTKKILESIKKEYQDYYEIIITEKNIDEIIRLSNIYLHEKKFPDKAIDLLDEACSYQTSKQKANRKRLENETIRMVVSDMSGIPLSSLENEEKSNLKLLKENLKKRIVGQEKPIDSISNCIVKSRIGFKDENKPIGVFLFLGPTGTGKTYLTKCLSEFVFGENQIIRLDMSEYMEKFSVNKITGSPPGYVGYDHGSHLLDKVRKKPYSVILLDEIEKAHPEVLNIFLQIFDEGRTTDNMGRFVDFRNTIIIMTSNLSTAKINNNKSIGFVENDKVTEIKEIEKFLNEEVKKKFQPEFINRINEVVVFNKLTKENIFDITKLEVQKVIDRAKLNDYILNISDDVINHIAKVGYNELYGARPILRSIERLIEFPMVNEIISGNIDKGIVSIIMSNEEIVFAQKKLMEKKNGKSRVCDIK